MESRQISLLAFHQIQPVRTGQQSLVYAAIATYGPMTDNEIEEKTGLKGSTVRPRRGELSKEQWIMIAGYTIQKNGRKATLWKVT